MKKITIILTIFIAMTINATAQTNVSGMISSNATWTLTNSPYIVTGNVLLDSGYTLTIEPGVTVKFDSLKCLQIGGTLTAKGTNNNPITFTSHQANPVPGYWGYILFNQTSVGYDTTSHTGSIFQYCIVEYGGNQHVPNSNGAIRSDINNTQQNLALPYIDHCIVRNNAATGIEIVGSTNNYSSLLRITNCDVYNNTSASGAGGIDVNVVPLSSAYPNPIFIIGNKVHDNIGAIGGIHGYGGGNTNGIISDNIVINNIGGSGGGINSYSCDVSYNILFNNTSSPIINGFCDGSGLYCYASNIYNNLIVNNANSTLNNPYGRTVYAWGCQMYNNTVIDNIAMDEIIYCNPYLSVSSKMNYNTITRNSVTALAPTDAVSISEFYPVFKHNNIYGNATTYQLINTIGQGGDNVDARYCWWGTASSNAIDSSLYDYLDNGTLSIINYSSFQTSPDTAAPVTPPVNVIKADLGGGNIKITWNANPETDLGGYKVYYGSPTGYSFSHSMNVGNVLTYTLLGYSITDTIAVTAYDAEMDSVQDQFEGHESWFTYAVGKPSPVFDATPLSICPGDTVYFTAHTPELYPYANTTWTWSFPDGMPTISSAQNPKVIYYTPGAYNVKLKVTNIAGSDSLTFTNYINVKSPSFATIWPYVCNTGNYTSPSGMYTWYSSGIYHDTITNHAGCDSVLTIHLTLSYNSYNNINPESCGNYTSPSGNYIWTNSGLYTDTIPNMAGCDSIVFVNLTVYNIDTTVTLVGSTLMSGATSGNYQWQWLDCGNSYAVIPGDTNNSFTPTSSGDYAVQITRNICVDTSSCYTVTIIGVDALNNDKTFTIYPNPASNTFTLNIINANNEDRELEIYNAIGVLVRSEILKQNNLQINIGSLSNGVYMIAIKAREWTENKKLIIQR